jgi:hypothetical protein
MFKKTYDRRWVDVMVVKISFCFPGSKSEKRGKNESVESDLYCRAVCIPKNFSGPQNPRIIIKSGFKSRVVSNQERVLMAPVRYLNMAHFTYQDSKGY